MDDYIMDDEMYQRVREVLGEYAHNWVFAAEGPDGSFYYDFSTPITGKALMCHALAEMCKVEALQGSVGVEYFVEEEEDGDLG